MKSTKQKLSAVRTLVSFMLLVLLMLLNVSCETVKLNFADFSKSLTLGSSLGSGSSTNASIAHQAVKWNNKSYKAGVRYRCADWVGFVVAKSNCKTPLPKNHLKASSWASWGKPVPRGLARKGDVVVLKNTYKGGISHVGIYMGDSQMIHRSTFKAPVRTVGLDRYYKNNQFYSFRRG